jgi:hemerythrin-like domain-containing protein
MNKAIEVLDKEHRVITEMLDRTDEMFKSILNSDGDIGDVKKQLEFFRFYADEYHHNKEEKILFPEMVKRNEMLEFGIIHEMLENHEDFRELLGEVNELIDTGSFLEAYDKFREYSRLLLEHIAVEDEEVFQIAETLFSDDELQTIYYHFEDCDLELGKEEKLKLEEI